MTEEEKLDLYYREQERKNIALIDCWGKGLWYAFWIAISLGMCWLMYRGLMCWLQH